MLLRSLGFIALVALVAVPLQANAQQPKINETHATLNWILGRWRMPATCELADGSHVDVEEAVVFRAAPEDSAGRTIRATFFGIDVADAVRCYNLMEKNIPDRRGVLVLTFPSSGRSDIGLRNLMKHLRDDRGLSYVIRRGTLHVRQLGADEAERVDFNGAGADLIARLLPYGSDGDRLLAPLADKSDNPRSLRRIQLEIARDGVPEQSGFYLEDGERRPGRRR
jgi:hypothetical protein